MTRAEQTGVRSLAFSKWIREELPDSSTGFCVTNQDWVLWNFKTKTLMLLEEKTHGGKLAPWFSRLIKEVLDPALRDFCVKGGIEYKGYHLIVFENETPDDGLIWLDGVEVDKEFLKEYLSI